MAIIGYRAKFHDFTKMPYLLSIFLVTHFRKFYISCVAVHVTFHITNLAVSGFGFKLMPNKRSARCVCDT